MILVGVRDFSLLSHPNRLCSPPRLLFNGYQGSFLQIQAGHEVDHSPPTSAEVKKEYGSTQTPPVCLHGVDRDSCIFTFTTKGKDYNECLCHTYFPSC